MKSLRLLLFILLFSLTAGCHQNKEEQPNFEGTYHCKGFDPYINEYYAGEIVVTPQNAVYSLKMDYDNEHYVGTAGLYDNNMISVVFQDPKDLKKVGLERYSYSKDRRAIQGYWVYLGKDKLGKEVCQKAENL